VANHRDATTMAREFFNRRDLVFGHQRAAGFGKSDLQCYGIRDALVVACQHNHPLDAQLTKTLKDTTSGGALAVHEAQRSEVLSAAPHNHDCATLAFEAIGFATKVRRKW